MPRSFTKSKNKLCVSQDFRIIRKEGIQKMGDFILIYQKMTSQSSRLGITVSKKFGKAHKRNRFKRIARAAFQLFIDKFPQGFDIEIIPKKLALRASMQDIQKDLVILCDQQDPSIELRAGL